MIQSLSAFIDYFEGIRRRTLNYIRAIPADKIDWQPNEKEYTCGDIVRHLAAAELMYVGVIVDGKWKYPGHERGNFLTLEDNLIHLQNTHTAAMEKLRTVSDDILMLPRPSLLPDVPPIKAWRWLMAMVEHEVHHRSQLASYLTLMGVEPPQIYGVKVEELMALAGE